MKLFVGITSPGSTILLKGQLSYFKEYGYHVYLLCPYKESVMQFCDEEGATHIDVDIARRTNPLKDIIILFKLIYIFRRHKPDIVNVGTPKMGLLGTMAARLSRVGKIIYTCRGLRYEHESGFGKIFLKHTERISGFCAHHIIGISTSVIEKAVQDNVFPREKTVLIGNGSSNGIDISKFDRSLVNNELREALIQKLGLRDKFVFGFVGRLLDRKGIQELVDSFVIFNRKNESSKLIIVGSITKGQFSNYELLEIIDTHDDITWVGFQSDVPLYMSLFDVLLLPAWWEGFGNVLIQAAAMGVPVISTNGTGCRDAFRADYNGLQVPAKDTEALLHAMVRYHENRSLLIKHGENGKEWVKNFDSAVIWKGLKKIYES